MIMAKRRAVSKDAARVCHDSNRLWNNESSSMAGLAWMNRFRLWQNLILLDSGDVRRMTASYSKYKRFSTRHGGILRAHSALGWICHTKKPLYLQRSSRGCLTKTRIKFLRHIYFVLQSG
jgi:hypothetical protein